jgi:hypothetical protein
VCNRGREAGKNEWQRLGISEVIGLTAVVYVIRQVMLCLRTNVGSQPLCWFAFFFGSKLGRTRYVVNRWWKAGLEEAKEGGVGTRGACLSRCSARTLRQQAVCVGLSAGARTNGGVGDGYSTTRTNVWLPSGKGSEKWAPAHCPTTEDSFLARSGRQLVSKQDWSAFPCPDNACFGLLSLKIGGLTEIGTLHFHFTGTI